MTPSRRLVCHPDTPAGAVRRIAARVRRTADGTLGLAFALEGDLSCLRIPAPRRTRIGHELWRHTCFEAFLALEGAAAYHELNLSPSGAWTAYAFHGYRDGVPLAEETPAPRIAVRRRREHLGLDAEVSLGSLAPTYPRSPLRLALAAVVEAASGALSYWALHHPPGRPDFHHADAFVLRLEPPRGAC